MNDVDSLHCAAEDVASGKAPLMLCSKGSQFHRLLPLLSFRKYTCRCLPFHSEVNKLFCAVGSADYLFQPKNEIKLCHVLRDLCMQSKKCKVVD